MIKFTENLIKEITKVLQSVEVQKPWGSYKVIYESKEYRDDSQYDEEFRTKIKFIVVNPGQKISLQSHKYREETWLITSGEAKVHLGGLLMILPGEIKITNHKVGDSIFIEKHQIHRIENPSRTDKLMFIEIQTGESFEEEDIIRYEDDYGRIVE